MLSLEAVRLRQGDFTLSADWEMPEEGHLALIGPSGSGKSTLLLAIAGFLAPEAGRILWQGRDLGPLAPGERPVTMMFQDQNLFPHLSIEQNLCLGLSPDLKMTAERRDRVAEALGRVGLAGLGARHPAELSGGQQGRAALARALLRARPLLLLDEPFAALGPGLRAEMLGLVGEVAAVTGAKVILVSHDPRDVQRLAAFTALVAGGTVAAPVPTREIFVNPPQALRDYLG